MQSTKLSRRYFLKISALAAAGVAATACAKTEAPAATPEAVPPTATSQPVVPTPTKETAQPTPTPMPEPAGGESPMLSEMVASGALPPLEERLPSEARVIEPFDSIGTHGGTMHQGWDSFSWGRYAPQTGFFHYDMAGGEIIPDVAKSFSWSDDVKTLTLEFRRGHKWSDGAPFTVDDIMFWWEDTEWNAELAPNGPSGIWKPGGEPAEFEKIDDLTIQITFAVPAPYVLDGLGRTRYSADPRVVLPKHYLEKWHKSYNPDADAVAKAENQEDWTKAFTQHARAPYREDEPERPLLFLWVLESGATDRVVNVRNSYCHHVDPEGNQLPYVDRLDYIATGDAQVSLLKASSGEFDLHAFNISLFDMPVLLENEAAGDYHVVTPMTMITSDPFIALNRNVQDPVLNELFNNKDFRIALSIAIDRDAINDAVWFGLGRKHAVTPGPWMSYYQEEWSTKHIDYAPDRASELLDAVGLTEKDADGFRLRADNGQPIELFIDICSPEGPKLPTCERVVNDWAQIGIKATASLLESGLCTQREKANEYQIATHHSDRGTLFGRYNPVFFGWEEMNHSWCPEWVRWFISGGEQGLEPPSEIKSLKALFDDFRTVLPGTPEFDQMGAEYYGWFAEELAMIGTCGLGPQPIVVKNRLRNFPERDIYWVSDTNFYQPYLPSQWWLEG